MTYGRTPILVCFMSIIPIINSCSYFVSWDDAVSGGIGRHIESIIKLDGPPTSIKELENGSKEYKYHFKKIDETCLHYWVVDKNGTITGYHYTGRCRPIG